MSLDESTLRGLGSLVDVVGGADIVKKLLEDSVTSKQKSKLKPRINFEKFHKKANLKFTEKPEEIKRGERQEEMEARRKEIRANTLMAKRGITTTGIPSPSISLLSSAAATPAQNTRGVPNRTANKPSFLKKNVLEEKEKGGGVSGGDNRRLQLQEWKKQKDLVKKTEDRKAVFKPGGVTVQKTAVPCPSPKKPVHGSTGTVIRRPPTATAASTKATVNPVKPKPTSQPPVERRVTRAMLKAPYPPQHPVKVPNPPPSSSTSIANKAAAQLKNLAINNAKDQRKGREPDKQIKTTADNNVPKIRPGLKTQQKQGSMIPAELMKEDGVKNGSCAGSDEVVEVVDGPNRILAPSSGTATATITVTTERKKKKKPKPKAIDDVYMQYNGTFHDNCRKLDGYSKRWKTIIETTPPLDIPDDVKGDIDSAMGKIKLLLGSKLPQFGELLYQYLCQDSEQASNVDPDPDAEPPVLKEDLQGWWDVAYIQIERVYTEFENLEVLKNRSWVKPVQEPPAFLPRPFTVKQSVQMKAPKPKVKVATPKKKTQPKARQDLKAFLAMKRKENNGDGEQIQKDAENDKDVQESRSPDTRFEGGFFSVSSPARKTPLARETRSSKRLQTSETNNTMIINSPTTPGRRQLSTNTSLRMLSLRNSVGRVYAIGARNETVAGSELAASDSFLVDSSLPEHDKIGRQYMNKIKEFEKNPITLD